jgi:hypothetical protein
VQPPSAEQARVVDEGAVARQAVVDHGPHAADALEQRVHARDLGIPVEAQAMLGPTPERELVGVLGQDDDLLVAALVAEEDEGKAGPLHLEASLQLSDRLNAERRGCHRGPS